MVSPLLKELQPQNRPLLNHPMTLILLIIQALYLMISLHFVAQDYDFTLTYDNDAGMHISLVEKTEWYNYNGYDTYGPLLYRLSKTVSGIIPNLYFERPNYYSANESHIHFSLLLVSLLSLYLMTFAIARSLCTDFFIALTGAMLLVPVFFINEIWAKFLLRPYPDPLLIAVICFGVGHLMNIASPPASKSLPDKSSNSFLNRPVILQGLIWGIGALIKVSVAPFAFVAFLSLIFLHKKKIFQTAIQFILASCFTYLIIGFPQSLFFPHILKLFLGNAGYTASYILPVTWPYMQSFLLETAKQSWLPLLSIFILLILLPGKRREPSKDEYKAIIIGSICILAGLLFFLFQPTSSYNKHYPMGIAAGLTLVAARGFSSLFAPFRSKLGKKAIFFLSKYFPQKLNLKKYYGTWVAILVAASTIGLFPAQPMAKALEIKSISSMVYTVQDMIRKTAGTGKNIIQNPYTPTVSDPSLRNKISVLWIITDDDIKKETALLILSKSYYSRFLKETMSPYLKSEFSGDISYYNRCREFCMRINNSTVFMDKLGRKWEKSKTNPNGEIEIWQIAK